jgi:hypothetical protein
MDKPPHIHLLQMLKGKGIGVSTNISHFMAANFTKPKIIGNDSAARDKYVKDVRHIQLFINDLESRSFIDSDEQENAWINWLIDKEKPLWFDEIESLYYITTYGLDYLDEYENSEISKRANNALYWNIWATIILSIVILIISFKSYVVSKDAYSIAKSNVTTDSINSITVDKRLDTLSQLLLKVQQSLSLPKTQKTYPLQKRPSH